MNIKILAAGAATVGLLAGAGYLGLGGGDEVKPGPTEPVKVEELRAAVLPGTCPASTATEAAKCEEVVQLDGRCLCKTRQKVGQVDSELDDTAALPEEKRQRLVVCPGKKAEDPPVVVWEKDKNEPKAGCILVARPLVDVTVGDMDTDLTEQVRAACVPCPVTGASWGPCPHCLLTEGGCAAACPVAAE